MAVSSKDTQSIGTPRGRVGPAAPERQLLPAAALAARFLGALSLLAVGAVHLQQYEYLYSTIPTIGTLFLLNFAGATALGLGLLAPVERLLGRLGGFVVALLALAGSDWPPRHSRSCWSPSGRRCSGFRSRATIRPR